MILFFLGLNKFDKYILNKQNYNLYYKLKNRFKPQLGLVEQELNTNNDNVLSNQRFIRNDPSLRHIGLGKRFVTKIINLPLEKNFDEQNSWAMIGLGKKRK